MAQHLQAVEQLREVEPRTTSETKAMTPMPTANPFSPFHSMSGIAKATNDSMRHEAPDRDRPGLAAGAEERVPVERDVPERGHEPERGDDPDRRPATLADAEGDEVGREQRHRHPERQPPHQRQAVGLHERLEQQVGAVLDRADGRVERLGHDLVDLVGVLGDRAGLRVRTATTAPHSEPTTTPSTSPQYPAPAIASAPSPRSRRSARPPAACADGGSPCAGTAPRTASGARRRPR